MKKISLFAIIALFLLLICTSINSFGQLSSSDWSLTINGNASIIGNVTAGSHIFGSGVNTTTYGANGASSKNWNSASLNIDDYYEFSISPTTGNNLNITQLQLTHAVSSKSMTASVYYSLDGFATSPGTQVGSNITVSTTSLVLTLNSLSIDINDGQTLSLRIYGWGAQNQNRYFYVKDVSISGTTNGAVTIPLPVYRSTQSGNWNNSDIWEQKFSDNSWGNSAMFPTSDLTYSIYPEVAGTEVSAQTGPTSSHIIDLPSNILNGDLLLIFWADGNSTSTVTIPVGWTELYNMELSNYRRLAMFRIADGSESTTQSITTSANERSAHNSYRIAAGTYQGIPEVGVVASGTSTNPNPPNLDSGFGNYKTLWIAAAHTASNSTFTVIPTNYSSLLEINTGNQQQNDYKYATMGTSRRFTESSSEDPGTYTLSQTNQFWGANTIAIKGVSSSKVTVQSSHSVFISDDQSADALTISVGGILQIYPSGTLTVNSFLTNFAGTGGLVINSDVSGTGSLIHYTNGVNTTVQQLISPDEWHYVSSPISGATSNVFYGIHLKPFDEPTYEWGEYIIETNVGVDVMKGYAAWTYDPAIVSFQGPLNNGSQSITVTAQYPGPQNIGYNLVGNPFPSALDWDAQGWDKTNIDNTICFYSGSGGLGNYKYYVGSGGSIPGVGTETSSGIIPAMQGFFVKASANSTLSVTNSARVHSDQAYYKEGTTNDLPILRLKTTDANGLVDEAILRFYEEATIEHDGDYDAFKLFGWMYPQLYSITPSQSELAISTLPEYKNGTVIPLGFQSPEEGEYSISLSEFENFEESTEIYLEDMLNDVLHNLSVNPEYIFSSTPDDVNERFNLHFLVTEMGIEDRAKPNVKIYAYDNIVYIQSSEEIIKELVIVDLMGREVSRENGFDSYLISQAVHENTGYFIVQVRTDNDISTKKVFIK